MYSLLLALHNLNRWVLILVGLATLVGIVLWIRRREAPAWLVSAGRTWMIAFDVQLLLGLLLLAVSPVIRPGWSAPMEHPAFRYFVMEHGIPMVVALALVHWGYRTLKQAQSEEDPCWCRVWQLFIAWLIMVAVTPWDRPLLPFLG